MSDLIRGGQVTFHKFRMLAQVAKVLTKLSLVLLISSIIFCFWKNTTVSDWKVGLAWLKKDLYLGSDDNKTVTYPGKYGYDKTVKIKHLEHDHYVVSVIEGFERTFNNALITAVIIEIIVIGGVILFFYFRGRNIKKSKNLRGIFALKEEELKNQIQRHNNEFKGYTPFKIADFAYPIIGRRESYSSGEQSHTLLIGSTGSGKTTVIKNLIKQLGGKNQKAIIIDIKGDLIENFYTEKDIILNPLDKRGRNWSIFNETDYLKGFSTIAKSLLPRESKGDPIWSDAARGVVSELASLYTTENLSMNEFADKILKSDLSTLAKLLQKSSASKIINEDIEKAALSVLMVLSTYLRPLKLYRNSENCFSITDWVNDPQQQNFLFISSRADVKEDLNPIITTQVDIAVNALRSLKESSNIPKIWFILDEISYFDSSIPSLKDGLATARSYGGCFILGTQDMSSLVKIYSRETAESIANNCRTKLFMNVAGKETALWCSDSLGDGEIEEWHEGLSYGAHEMRDGIQVNQHRILRKNVRPSELMMLKAGEGYISFSGFAPAKFSFKTKPIAKIAEGYVENTELYNLFKKECEEAENRRKEIETKINSAIQEKGEIQISKNHKKQKEDSIGPEIDKFETAGTI